MKKIISTLMVSFIVTCQLQAQIEVYSNNKVGIGTSSTVNSMLSVNTTGNSNYISCINNPSTATGQGVLYLTKAQPASGVYGYGLSSTITSGVGTAVGIFASSYNSTALTTGHSYGIYAQAGHAQTGYNYGVYGRLVGTNNGAGIYGTLSGTDALVDGQYAGYFNGNTKVVGTLWVNTTAYTSDETAKKEVKQLDKNNMAKLKQLNGVSYKYKNPIEMGQYGTGTTDTVADPNTLFDAALYEQVHLGLLAQELQTVYPELVKTDPSGLLGIDYIGLIPVLLEAIKEQQIAIETLTDEVDKLKTKADR